MSGLEPLLIKGLSVLVIMGWEYFLGETKWTKANSTAALVKVGLKKAVKLIK